MNGIILTKRVVGMNQTQVDWYGLPFGVTGYSQHSRGHLLEFYRRDIDVSFVQCENVKQADLPADEERKLHQMQNGRRNDPRGDVNAIEVWNLNPYSAYFHTAGGGTYSSYYHPEIYKVLLTVYETVEIPADWVSICEGFNELWVPSEKVKQAFYDSGISNDMTIKVFREGVDTDKYYSGGQQMYHYNEFTFLSLFDFTYRKGWDKLIEGYCKEFDSDEGVRLVIKTHYSQNNERDKDYVRDRISAIKSQYDAPKIELKWDFIKEQEMPQFYRSGDAFVLPTRGEGFGLPLFEAAACDLPVIMTDFMAPSEYLGDNTNWVKVEQMKEYPYEEAVVHEPNCTGLQFAEPSVESLQKQMRQVYNGDTESPDMSGLGWGLPTSHMRKRLDKIYSQWPHY
jgi:glycosyltransferase involved in cell wall biosynthesis